MDINKNDILYRNVVKNRRKLLAILFVILLCFVMFTVSIYPYILKRVVGEVSFDETRFAASENVTIGPSFVRAQEKDEKIYGFATPSSTYWQDKFYYFSFTPCDIEPSNLSYTTMGEVYTELTDTEIEPVAVNVFYTTIGGKKTTILSLPDQKIEPGTELKGIFVKASPLILKDLSALTSSDEEISAYTFDVRGIEMGSEFSDIFIWILALIFIFYFSAKIIRYYINPYKHPTYKQLEKYGDIKEIASDIELQLQNDVVSIDGNQTITADWIITDEAFKKNINKNHTATGKFKYTP